MAAREALALALQGKLLSVHHQKVEVRGESAQKVQDIMAAIVSEDALALDGGAQLHTLVLLVQDAVLLDLKLRIEKTTNESIISNTLSKNSQLWIPNCWLTDI